MVDLSEGSLGVSGSDGLPERRSLHIQRPCHALHPVLYRHRLSIRTRRRHHPSSRQFMDDAEDNTTSGRPAILPLRGRRGSFAVLVNRYAGDPRVRTLLQELLRVKAVRRLPDKRLEVLSPTFATARWDDNGIEVVGERVRDLLATLVHNLKHPSRPRYLRFVVNAQVDPRFGPLLMRDLTEQAEVLADTFDDALNDPERTIRPARSAQDAQRVGVCIFVVEEAALVEPIVEPAGVPARRSRKPG